MATIEPTWLPQWPVPGWEVLGEEDSTRAWPAFERRFGFRPGTRAGQWPGITEPAPSRTWDLAVDRAGVAESMRTRGHPGIRDVRDAVNRLLLGALRACTAEDEWLTVLNWQHTAFRCSPHGFDPDGCAVWPVNVFPDGDYYVFLPQDFRFGTFAHPWEATLCVWGACLVDALEARDHGVLGPLLRRDGVLVGRG